MRAVLGNGRDNYLGAVGCQVLHDVGHELLLDYSEHMHRRRQTPGHVTRLDCALQEE